MVCQRRAWLTAVLVAACAGLAHGVPAPAPVRQAPPTAAEIVARNAAARGGTDAWQKISSMAWAGRVELGSAAARQLPFMLQQKRPNKTRFEILSEGQRSVRAFDGTTGWKSKPNPATGRPETQTYSADELAFARGAQVIAGPLMEYVARGAAVELVGEGPIEGRKAWVLEIKLASGGGQRVWVDAETYLELRHDRSVRGPMGAPGVQVTVLFRDYRAFEGLQLPTVIETSAEPGRPPNRLVIEKVALNPELDDSTFEKPLESFSRRRGVAVDTRELSTRQPGQSASRP